MQSFSPLMPVPAALAALFLGASSALAAPAPASTITAVTVYPGLASVERVLPVPAGSTQALFACLPAQLDARSLQVQSSRGVGLGEINIQTLPRHIASGCSDALEQRIRSAEDAVAQAQAQVAALELARTWLTTQASAPSKGQPAPAATPAQHIAAQADALRRTTVNTLTELHQAQRQVQAQEQALERLRAEQGSVQGADVVQVRVTLATAQDAQLRLSYQVPGPSWSPSYRARLDTARAQVELERLALVTQTTGEDWRGVQLTLSTGRPLSATQGPLPRPWQLDVQPPQRHAEAVALAAPAPAPASAPVAAARMKAQAAPALPDLEVVTTPGAYVTQFALPQAVTLPSGDERITLSLGSVQTPVTLVARTTPALDNHAWLVALLPTLEGDWPAGPITLERDAASVGQGRFDPHNSHFQRLGLSFGRDERIVVQADPVQENTGSTGLMSGRTERTLQRRFLVENRHTQPRVVQLLDAAPIAQNNAIRVQSSYHPEPTHTAWGEQPGTVLWQQEIPAQGQQRWSVQHSISHDKEVVLRERR